MTALHLDIIGTHLVLTVYTGENLDGLFMHITDYLTDFEKKYSRFLESNWLQRLNTERKNILDEDARNMVLFSLALAKKSDGYFDPTVARALVKHGYGKNTGGTLMTGEGFSDYRDILVEGDEISLRGDIHIEFGGVGKGYLIDQIKSRVESYFVDALEKPHFLVNFGGDFYGYGDFTVALENPLNLEEAIGTVKLMDHFLACSAPTRRTWKGGHHLIDPKTGIPSQDIIASFVRASGDVRFGGMLVDSIATTLCVMPAHRARQFLRENDRMTTEAVIVEKNGQCFIEGAAFSLF